MGATIAHKRHGQPSDWHQADIHANVNNKIIGITGTKGKSTTASLVDHILKTSGRKSILAGNIGMPMLSIIDEILDNNNINSSSQNDKKMDETIIVLELSSYQLSDIKYSPHIGCILNIYPEHLNYHQTINQYIDAKANIVKYCQADDYYVYNPDFYQLADIKTKAKVEKYLRIFYFSFVGKTIILLHAFFKKTPKTPQREIDKAIDNYNDFIINQQSYDF